MKTFPNIGTFTLSLVYNHITVVEIVDMATANHCTCLNKRKKRNSAGCLVKLDFFAVNDVRKLSLLFFVPGVICFHALFLPLASFCDYFGFWNSTGV